MKRISYSVDRHGFVPMPKFAWVGLVVLAVALAASLRAGTLAGSAQNANAGNAGNPGVMPPQSHAFGKSYAQWEAAWWQWAISIPEDHHPLTDTADCSTGQSGAVWFLGGSFVSGTAERNCTVPANTALFFPLINVECSTVEAPPFFGSNEQELRDCAKSFMDPVAGVFCIIDGVPVQNVDRYRVQSPLFNFRAPDPNVLFVPGPVSGQSVGDGFYLLVKPLAPGDHTLHFGGTFTQFDFALDITYHLTVQ